MIEATTILDTLVEGNDLSAHDTRAFLESAAEGELTSAQIAGILVALRIKGETPAEILGLVEAMRSLMTTIEAQGAIDIVGTGGDGAGTFNISTASALVVAGAGIGVAKHGNRAASSKCGSADVLEALGVNIELTKEEAEEVYTKAGMVFLFAPAFHPATKNVVAVRKELKTRTIFNVLGPFANPAKTKRQLVGVSSREIAKKMLKAAKSLEYEHLLIVTGDDGLDEISIAAKTRAFLLRGSSTKAFTIDPRQFGIQKASVKDLAGSSATMNADIIRNILGGKKGPQRDVVVLNSAFALYVADAVKTPKEGIKRAQESIDSGKAREALKKLIHESVKFTVHV